MIRLNDIKGCRYIEPFAGGGGVALGLLMRETVCAAHLNDLDRSIYAFWYAVKHRNSELCDRIRSCRISIAEWDRQKAIQKNKSRRRLLDLAFSTLFLNRTNRSGNLRGGMIGGRDQSGTWNIKSRFDKGRIIDRIQTAGEYSENISISNKNSLKIDDLTFGSTESTLIYMDPPYFSKADRLYMNHLTEDDHARLEKRIREAANAHFVITYDTSPTILKLYEGYRRRFLSLAHTAAQYRVGKEVMLFSDGLKIPRKIR